MTTIAPDRDITSAGATVLIEDATSQVLRLLVVDDDEAILDSMRLFLTLAGHEVTIGSRVLDVANYVTDNPPDVLIADFWLAGETGLDVIRSVRDAASTLIPIIIFTGDTSHWQIEQEKLPNCQVMRKPVDMNKLLAVARSLHSATLDEEGP